MATIESTISPGSEAFQANRSGMLALLQRVRSAEARAVAASNKSHPRFESRGQLLPRERLALLLDPGAPWLELCTLAGYGMDTPDPDHTVPGGGVIGGIGWVAGIRCMVSASDSGIDAGAMQAMGLDKALRIQELALENKLPYVQLVESAGANLLKYRVEASSRVAGCSATWRACRHVACRWSPSRMARPPPAAPTRPACRTTSSWCAAAPGRSWPARRC